MGNWDDLTMLLPHPLSRIHDYMSQKRYREALQAQDEETKARTGRIAGDWADASQGYPLRPKLSPPWDYANEPAPPLKPTPSANPLKQLLLSGNREVLTDLFTDPDFEKRIRSLQGDEFTLSPGSKRFGGLGEEIASVAPNKQSFQLGQGGELVTLDPATGEVVNTRMGPPKEWSPNEGQPKPVDPILDLNRRDTARRNARNQVLQEQGLADMPGVGVVDTIEKKPISYDRLKKLNADVDRLYQEKVGQSPAPTIDAPRSPAALPAYGTPTDSGPQTMSDRADPNNDSYSPRGSVADQLDEQRAMEQAGGDPEAAVAILQEHGLQYQGK